MQLNGVSTLEARRKFIRVTFLYNYVLWHKYSSPCQCETPVDTTYSGGHEFSLSPIVARSNALEIRFSFLYSSMEDWNTLPSDIFHSSTFLDELKRHLLS